MIGEPVKFGILGLGMGEIRARQAQVTEGAQLVCVCDLREEKARQIANELSCDWTTSFDEMLRRDDIDVIGVLTPSGTHCDYAIKAIRAGKHTFVTKPMDIRVEKCDEAIEVARKARAILAVDFELRYNETSQKIKLAIDKGRLGKLMLADLRMKWFRTQEYYEGGYPPGWRKSTKTEGGSAANQAAHYIDLAQWFMGPVRSVYGRSRAFAHSIGTEDLSIAIVTFGNGAWGSFVTTTASYPELGTQIGIHGDNGSILWEDGHVSLYRRKDEENPSLDEFQLDPNRVKNIIEDMVSAVRNRTRVAVDGKEGRKTVAIFNAIYKSSRTGKRVELY